MIAFESAIENGADIVELDVQMTKDGSVAVLHDRSLKRVAGVDLPLYQLTLAEAKKLDVGIWKGDEFKGLKIPSLTEVLENFNGKISMIIELKPQYFHLEEDYGLERKVLEIMDECSAKLGNGYISVRSESSYAYLVSNSQYPVGLMQKKRTASEMNRIVEDYNIKFAQIRLNQYTAAEVEELKRFGAKITVFYGDRPSEWQTILGWNVYGIFTNYPKNLKDYLSAFPSRMK